MTLYDSIGKGYAKSRLADRRIVQGLVENLGLPKGSTVLDVGAGTGKYSSALAECGYQMIGIEPSAVMRGQASGHPGVREIAASAEAMPLEAGAADGAFIVLAYHHFTDRPKALHEILRVVGRGPLVIFTFEPSRLRGFWLADYFPSWGGEHGSSFFRLADVPAEIQVLTGRSVRRVPFPLPRDLMDRFGAAGWATPESYLDEDIRSGISWFQLMKGEELEEGLVRLRRDLRSGGWDARYGHLRTQETLDVGYSFIVATSSG